MDDIARDISEHVERLSEFSHTTADVLAKPESEAMTLIESTLDLFARLLAAIERGEETLIDEVQMALTTTLGGVFINDFFDELDTLSTHTKPTGADDIEVSIASIDKDKICFAGRGSVSCDLQYGSDGDCERGDGVEWGDSFPFTFQGTADTNSLQPDVPREDVSVDTSKHHPEGEVGP